MADRLVLSALAGCRTVKSAAADVAMHTQQQSSDGRNRSSRRVDMMGE
jgi:hypothetical protein